MDVNVGTVGHVDSPRRVLVVGGGSILGRSGMTALAMMGILGNPMPYMPKPKPVKRLTAADLERIEAAEAKRQRKANKANRWK
jgi:hypothetical protein